MEWFKIPCIYSIDTQEFYYFDYCSLPLTFTIGHGSIKHQPREFLWVLQTVFPVCHCAVIAFLDGNKDQSLQSVELPLFFLLIQWHKKTKMSRCSLISNRVSYCCIPSFKHYPLGNKTPKPVELNVSGTDSKTFVSCLLGIILRRDIPTFNPWSPDSCILAMGERAPYDGLWFKE